MDWLIQMASAGDLVVDFVGKKAEAHKMLKRFHPFHTWVILGLHLVYTWVPLAPTVTSLCFWIIIKYFGPFLIAPPPSPVVRSDP